MGKNRKKGNKRVMKVTSCCWNTISLLPYDIYNLLLICSEVFKTKFVHVEHSVSSSFLTFLLTLIVSINVNVNLPLLTCIASFVSQNLTLSVAWLNNKIQRRIFIYLLRLNNNPALSLRLTQFEWILLFLYASFYKAYRDMQISIWVF